MDQPGFADVIELVKTGKVYVKVSGAYLASKAAPDYSDVVPFAKALISANPERIIWGTDWPHPDSAPPARDGHPSRTPPGKKPTDVTPLLQIDDGRLLNQLSVGALMRKSERRYWSRTRLVFMALMSEHDIITALSEIKNRPR